MSFLVDNGFGVSSTFSNQLISSYSLKAMLGLFGPPPAGGPPPLPAPPGGVAPPVDPDTGKPDDPEDPDNNSSTKTISGSSTASSTVSSSSASRSSSSSAASCVAADVAIASDYPFAIDENGEELASVTISEDIIYSSMTVPASTSTTSSSMAPSSVASPPTTSSSIAPLPTMPSSAAPAPTATQNFSCNTGSSYKRINPDKAKDKIKILCQRYHDDKMILSEASDSLPDDKYSDDEDIGGVAEDEADTEVNPNFALSACANGNTVRQSSLTSEENPEDTFWTIEETLTYSS